MRKLEGIIPAIVTPLNDNKIYVDGLKELIEYILKNPVGGIFALGTTGEFYALSDNIKTEMIKETVKIVNDRVPVVIGAGDISTDKTVENCNLAYDLGADYVSVITPYFIKYSDKEIISHYKKVAEKSKLPVIIYNIPQRTGNHMSLEMVAELSKEYNIIGIKDSSGDLNNIKGYIENKQGDFAVFAGTDSLILDTLKSGGNGAVAATGNLIPDILCELFINYKEGKYDECEKLQSKVNETREIFKFGTVPSPIKKALNILKIDVGTSIHPSSGIIRENIVEIKKILNKLSLF